MIDFIYKRGIIKIREVLFCSFSGIEMANSEKYDSMYIHTMDEAVLDKYEKAGIIQLQETLITDLTEDEEEIKRHLKKNCRYEIRRAEREGAVFKFYSTLEDFGEDVLGDFERIYNAMFESKNLKNRFNMCLMRAALENGNLLITQCIDPNGLDSVYHALFTDNERAVLIYSASPLLQIGDNKRLNMIGYMNKYLHWKEMQYFKNNGCKCYEWGGISNSENPNGIDRFKMEFGGEVRKFVNYIIPNSILGKIYVLFLKRRQEAVTSKED